MGVAEDVSNTKGELLLDGVPVDPYTLRDGNGRIITCER
jgi:hypothetical protein